MTPTELKRMRNPLSAKNVRLIRRTLGFIDLHICCHSSDLPAAKQWFREISDDLCACMAILNEWSERKKRK